jgi:acyl-CoA synthetase (AMP-forming)/AMP-acid ligase II
MVVSMLAVVLAGKAYCNIEPDLPLGRKQDIVAEAVAVDVDRVDRPVVIGAIEGDVDLLDPFQILREHMAALRRRRTLSPPSAIFPRPSPSAPAYLIYTSGSTGKPKGIIVTHANVAAFLRNYRGIFGRCRADEPRGCRVLQFASYGFDVVVMNIWDTFAVRVAACSAWTYADTCGSTVALSASQPAMPSGPISPRPSKTWAVPTSTSPRPSPTCCSMPTRIRPPTWPNCRSGGEGRVARSGTSARAANPCHAG